MTPTTKADLDPADGMPSRSALAKELLLYHIRQFSETFYEEDWVEDIEFDYWDMGHDPDFEIGGTAVSESLAKLVRDLATLAGGWWVWPELVGQDGERPVFISMAEWKKCLAKREA
jgi:hypothetical protein